MRLLSHVCLRPCLGVVTDSPHDLPTAATQVEELLLDRTFDGVVRVVRQRMPGVPAQTVEDALMLVVARLVANGHGPKDNIFWYLVNAACHQAKNLVSRDKAAGELPLDAAAGLSRVEDMPCYAYERAEGGRLALEYLLTITRTWDSEGMALVTELHLRAALDDEPLSAAEAARIASGVLDREVTEINARQLKARGFRRLAEQLDPDSPIVQEDIR